MAKLMRNSGFKKGVFVKEAEILDIMTKEEYAKEKGWEMNSKFIRPIELRVVYTTDKGEHQKALALDGRITQSGNFPFNMSQFLRAIGIINTENKDSILDELEVNEPSAISKEFFTGKKFRILEYRKANGFFEPWNGNTEGFSKVNVFDLSTDIKDIIAEFNKKLESNYPPPYVPEDEQSEEEPPPADTDLI